MRATLFFLTTITLTTPCSAQQPEEMSALRLVGTISLPGVVGRIDHMAVDAQGKRLFVAALGNNTVEIIDLEHGKQIGRISALNKPQGVCTLPDPFHVVVASGDDGKCRMYDASQKVIGTIDSLDDADNVRYDAQAKKVYVGYGDGALAVIDADKFTVVASIKLEGHPESFQLKAKGKRIFVNVPPAGHVAVIDRDQHRVIATWPIKEAKANFPMALDEANHRLFVGCRMPAKLIVMDTDSGKTTASLDCCGDADDIFYDAANKRIYVTGGEGCVSVFDQKDANTYSLVEKLWTAPGARTSFFVPTLHRLFVAVPKRDQQQAELRVYESQPKQ